MKFFFIILLSLLLLNIIYIKCGLVQKRVTLTVIQPTEISSTVTIPFPSPKKTNKSTYIENVPFSPQAPFGNWKDPLEQNGCEEAAAILAVYWAKNKPLSKQQMLNEIKAISDYEDKNFGNSVDTSVEDTVTRIFHGYYHYLNSRTEKLSSSDQIINWLNADYLVITPMNGKKIMNHNYTPPGPERHMIVIRGYDQKTDEFITNDAGTRLGENFRYSVRLFYSAVRDYPTGDHWPITDQSSKSAILVWK